MTTISDAIAGLSVQYNTSGCAYTALRETLKDCGYYLYCDWHGDWVDITGSMGYTTFDVVDSEGKDCSVCIEFDWYTLCTGSVKMLIGIKDKGCND